MPAEYYQSVNAYFSLNLDETVAMLREATEKIIGDAIRKNQ